MNLQFFTQKKFRMGTSEEEKVIIQAWQDDKKFYREAKEIFLFMDRNVRVSRNVRARWFFEHLDQLIGINIFNNTIISQQVRLLKKLTS